MYFSDYECDNEKILELLNHLPITTQDDYPWMNKFVNDLLFHYQKEEYELSIISAHLIYMYILYCYMLKKHEFNLESIQGDFNGKKEKQPENISPFVYSIKHERGIFWKPLLNIEDCIENHDKVVGIRNDVAHASGNHKDSNDFINYLELCLDNIVKTKNVIWENFRRSNKFNQAIQNMTDWNDIVPVYLISQIEFRDLFEERCNNKIQEKLSDISFWQDMIDNTTPANYGVNDSDIWLDNITLDYENMDSEYIEGTFEADVSMEFTFQMGASNSDDGYEERYNKQLHITGSFDYDITSDEFNIKIDEFPSIDFYAE